jgi:hypothetical protein
MSASPIAAEFGVLDIGTGHALAQLVSENLCVLRIASTALTSRVACPTLRP